MAKKEMPKKKGGAVFPRIDLEEAVGYTKKLVSKTHTGPQQTATLFPGVFGAKGGRAQIRASALKQYGLMKGSAKNGYEATEAAKDLVHAPDSDRTDKLEDAALSPKIFGGLYATFQGDKVSIPRVRQQAANLKVHPDNVDTCAALFISSLVYSGLATADGDECWIKPRKKDRADDRGKGSDDEVTSNSTDAQPEDDNEGHGAPVDQEVAARQGRAVIQVNVTLDSTLDTEKLERQLELLRRYGAL